MSADLFLGVPYNITSYAFLLHLLALMTGRIARKLHLRFGDFHLYEVHETEDGAISQLQDRAIRGEYYQRPEFRHHSLPNMTEQDFKGRSTAKWMSVDNFSLDNYISGSAIPARMIE